jgi:ATP-binding cassette subfamily B protein
MTEVADVEAQQAAGRLQRWLLFGDGQWKWLAGAAVATVVGAVAGLVAPIVVGAAIDDGIRAGDAAALDRAVVILVAIAAAGFLANRAKMLLTARVGQSVLARGRLHLMAALHRRSVAEVELYSPGRVAALLTSDLSVIEGAVGTVVPVLGAAIASLLVASTVLAIVSPVLFAIAMSTVPLALLAARRFRRRSRVVYRSLRARTADAVAALDEEIQGAKVAKAYGRVADRAARFDAVNGNVMSAEIDAMWTRNLLGPVIAVAGGLSTALTVAAGGMFAINGRFGITIGVITAFVLSLSSIFQPMQQVSFVLDSALSARAAFERIAAFVSTTVGLPVAPRPEPLPAAGDLELRGVGFTYPQGTFALRDVDLRIRQGERVAVVGRTGAGKSTLASLLTRLADPTEGTVTFGGVSLRDADPTEVRRAIRLVAQEGLLIAGTVADNIRLVAPEASDDDVASVLRSLDGGVAPDADVRLLSSGQGQLVALAQISLTDPAVVVLDEATSAIDPRAELVADRVLRSRTAIVIAHRPSTAARCDRVIVLDDGRIVADGPPEMLLRAGSAWSELLADATIDGVDDSVDGAVHGG